jgi:hypothetical protein
VGNFLATRYALPSPVECSLLRRGFNDSFEVLDANGQRYVLRLSCRRTRGEADVAHQQDPTWLARKTGDRKLFSSAQLIYRETEEKESYTAVIRVKSESGDYNQDELRPSTRSLPSDPARAATTPSGIRSACPTTQSRPRPPSGRDGADAVTAHRPSARI